MAACEIDNFGSPTVHFSNGATVPLEIKFSQAGNQVSVSFPNNQIQIPSNTPKEQAACGPAKGGEKHQNRVIYLSFPVLKKNYGYFTGVLNFGIEKILDSGIPPKACVNLGVAGNHHKIDLAMLNGPMLQYEFGHVLTGLGRETFVVSLMVEAQLGESDKPYIVGVDSLDLFFHQAKD